MGQIFGFLTVCFAFLLSAGSAQGQAALLPSHTPAPRTVSVSSPLELLQRTVGVEGANAIWHYSLREQTEANGIKHRYGRIVFRPYASSSKLCRTYALTLTAPSPWVYGHDGNAKNGLKSYQVANSLLMAWNPHARQCSEIALDHYFRVDREITDHEAKNLLSDIKLVLKDWNTAQVTAQQGKVVRLSSLKAISLADKLGHATARFAFNLPSGTRIFDVQLPAHGKPKYSTVLEMP